jgi:LysM repeat protein
MNRRKRRAILKRCGALLAVVLMTVTLILLFTSFAKPKQTTIYTVQKGDNLYTIAEAFGIENWRKFAYETCEINGLEQGGLIFPGQDIVILH